MLNMVASVRKPAFSGAPTGLLQQQQLFAVCVVVCVNLFVFYFVCLFVCLFGVAIRE
jgi:hypothetical protein